MIGIFLLPISSEPSLEQQETISKDSFFLTVPRFQLNYEIKEDIFWLDQNKVCSLEPILDISNTILLFGHNRFDVFHFLYDLKIGDTIILENRKRKEFYHVTDIKVIPVTEKKYLTIEEQHEIRLFTCMKDFQYRLLVIAK